MKVARRGLDTIDTSFYGCAQPNNRLVEISNRMELRRDGMRARLGWLLVALMLGLALAAAGCGDDDDDGGNGGEPTGVQAGTGTRADAAREAGMREAEAAGGKTEMPAKKVGVLQIAGALESAQRAEAGLEQAAKTLGWTVTVCDAQGDPTKMARCGDTLLDRNVDAMFTLGVEPSIIKAQLQKAQNQNVPVFNFGGAVTPDPGFTGSYEPDEALGGRVLADYLVEALGEVEGAKPIAVHDYPAIWATNRSDELKKTIKGTDIEIAATHTTDAANLVEDTRRAVNAEITQNQDLKAFWFDFDSAGQAAAQEIGSQFANKEFPDRPLVATFHADLGTIDLMRQGLIDVVSDWPYDATAWVAVDQAAEFFARDTKPDKNPRPAYGGFDVMDYVIVTADDLPAEGKYREPKNDFVTFFKTKWEEEFGAQ
jgi:ABC-type sugar transport system substrate-binding protein